MGGFGVGVGVGVSGSVGYVVTLTGDKLGIGVVEFAAELELELDVGGVVSGVVVAIGTFVVGVTVLGRRGTGTTLLPAM